MRINGEATGDRFGRFLARSTDDQRLAIGEPGTVAIGADNNGDYLGHVRVSMVGLVG